MLTETYDLWDRLLPGAACAVHFAFNSPKCQDIVAIPLISQKGKPRLEEANGLIRLSTEVAVWQYEAMFSNSDIYHKARVQAHCADPVNA